MKKKILVAGTFDILHPGHIFLINEAAKLGDVYIVIATDKNRELYSGEAPIVPEQQRYEVMKSIKNVKDVKLGRHDNDTLRTVEEINPDIILLGPDQKFSAQKLQNALKMKGLKHIEVRRLENYYNKFNLHSSSLIKKKIIKKYKKNQS
ncbi:MAG: FAD synthase [Candidatus Lokiarchaeota archaeon]|nr:FAD synthase [Candidatus Lokiarchaeota archaeon]